MATKKTTRKLFKGLNEESFKLPEKYSITLGEIFIGDKRKHRISQVIRAMDLSESGVLFYPVDNKTKKEYEDLRFKLLVNYDVGEDREYEGIEFLCEYFTKLNKVKDSERFIDFFESGGELDYDSYLEENRDILGASTVRKIKRALDDNDYNLIVIEYQICEE